VNGVHHGPPVAWRLPIPTTPRIANVSRSVAAGLRVGRTRLVWVALLIGMTSVAGLLGLLEGGPQPRLDGLALAAPVDPTRPVGIETIFRTRQPLATDAWEGIVIHHSGSAFGSAATLAHEHEQQGLAGLGHHFVIGNGAPAPDGEIHVGYRWLDQLPGAHTPGPAGDLYNRHYIGICLVGDGDRRDFTDAQMAALIRLVSTLQQKFAIPNERVVLNRDVSPTSGPGRHFPEVEFRSRLASLADGF